MGIKLLERFTKKKMQITIQTKFRVEKVIKGYKLYVKWKEYHSSFNSWIDKKDFII